MSTQTLSAAKKTSTIFWSWLLVATLDLLAAIIQTLLMGGNVFRLCQYIASGVFGKDAFTDWSFAVYGVLFHYAIALAWTFLFFTLYSKFHLSRFNKFLVGIGYGILIWFVMNRVVLGLSNVTTRPFDLVKSLIAASILIVAIGIPLSLIAFSKNKN